MIDYKESIVEVSKVHGLILPDAEVEEINDALNTLLDDYISEYDMTEEEADDSISNDFWNIVREMIDDKYRSEYEL